MSVTTEVDIQLTVTVRGTENLPAPVLREEAVQKIREALEDIDANLMIEGTFVRVEIDNTKPVVT